MMTLHVPAIAGAGPPAAALSTFAMFCSAAWYFVTTSASITVATAVPELVGVAIGGVEEVLDEVVVQSRMVIRCVSLGLVFIAAVAIVRIGCCFLYWLYQITTRKLASTECDTADLELCKRPRDSFMARYGGRLRGGGKVGQGLSAKAVFSGYANSTAPPPYHSHTTRVDPDRLETGDEFAFIYSRGTRAGSRRTVTLKEKLTMPSGMVQLLCVEQNQLGEVIERKYWPSHMTQPEYPDAKAIENGDSDRTYEFVTPTGSPAGVQDSVRVADTDLSASSSVDASAQSVHPSSVSRAKSALGAPTEDWKATQAWRDAQRARGPVPRTPRTQFFTGPAMYPIMIGELRSMTSTLDGLQYASDHTTCLVQILTKLSKGVKVRIIFDKKNFLDSSCARQAPRMQELFENNCGMKVMKPTDGGNFACMHVKALCFDRKTLLTGSVNMTHNGFENNKEHMYRITEPTAVAEVLTDFESVWAQAEPVTQKLVDEMMSRHARRTDKDTGKTRSKGVSRTLSRSLSNEFDESLAFVTATCRQGRHRSPALANELTAAAAASQTDANGVLQLGSLQEET